MTWRSHICPCSVHTKDRLYSFFAAADRVIYTICTLCRDYERAGFLEGTKTGTRIATEMEQTERVP